MDLGNVKKTLKKNKQTNKKTSLQNVKAQFCLIHLLPLHPFSTL